MNHRQKKKRRKFESMMQEYGGAPSTYKEWGIDSAFHGSRVIAWKPYYIPEPYRTERSEG